MLFSNWYFLGVKKYQAMPWYVIGVLLKISNEHPLPFYTGVTPIGGEGVGRGEGGGAVPSMKGGGAQRIYPPFLKYTACS